MLRMKGLLNIEESSLPVVVHGVERYLFPETFLDEWPDSDTRSRIVFIVEDINESELSELLDEHCNYASK
jgi:G3E family GTPase